MNDLENQMARSIIGSLHQDAIHTMQLWYATGQKSVEQIAGELYGTKTPTKGQIASVRRKVVKESIDTATLKPRLGGQNEV